MGLELGSRSWPSDLLFLLDRFPRQGWADNPALGDFGHFWLQKHAAIRGLGDHLTRAGVELREGVLEAAQFQAGFLPVLRNFLGALESHHQVEDHHYFPIFRSIEPRTASGFEILESDHGILHQQIRVVVELATRFVRESRADLLRSRAEEYVEATDVLTGGLHVHLADEEDLLIPLLASRSG
jgi:iron-sulfur cluster repair protein YtfE (RIC family)